MDNRNGYTLIECMVVTAIIGITIITIPSLAVWIGQQGVALAVDQVTADIRLSRTLAITHKHRCGLRVNSPEPGQYSNTLNGQIGTLSQFRGGVHFLDQGPDGRPAAAEISFNRQGMSTSVVPKSLFLADADLLSIYRIQVRLPGGISVHRWANEGWR